MKKSEKKAILLVSFGTSYRESREKTIGAIENAVATAYPDYKVRKAFTSQMIIDKIRHRDGEEIDNMDKAMKRLMTDGIDFLVIQPTHVMNGYEYDKMMMAAVPYQDKFTSIKYGKPLLSDEQDYLDLIKILAEETIGCNRIKTAFVCMGHGTEHDANVVYTNLNRRFKAAGYSNYYVGTVEAVPALDDVIADVRKGDYQKVILLPLMIVAGDHANNDMAGYEDDSWKNVFQSSGYEVDCILKGLGEYMGVQRMFVEHVKKASNPTCI